MNGTENRKRAFPLAYRHPRPKGKAVRYGWELPVLQQKILCVKRRFLYILAANESAGKREFQLPATKIEALGIPVRTARNYLKELEAAGFIELVRSGKTTRTANDYQFCFRWLDDG